MKIRVGALGKFIAAIVLVLAAGIGVSRAFPSRPVYAIPQTYTFNPAADAYVYETSPTVNFGTNTSIAVDGSPLKRSYIRFDVANTTGTITRATLRVYAGSAQATGYDVYSVADSSWSENSITYATAPAYSSIVVGSSGPTTANTWTSVDVTQRIIGNGTAGFVLATTNTTNLNLLSRESSNPPQLIVETETSIVSPSPTGILPSPSVSPTPAPSNTATIAATGDMVCGVNSTGAACKQMQVSDLILSWNADAFLPLGDVQYESGEYTDFQNYYAPSYGRLNNIVKPAIGNHEYNDPSTGDPTRVGYWDYFNGVGNADGVAGNRAKGYYSYNLGNWHIIALNTNCSKVGGCQAGSVQEQWLRNDLAANTGKCILAYAHHPLFSSGGRAVAGVKPLWKALQDYRTDVFLTGHDHSYERFAYQNADGIADPNGIREFVVGTGGRNMTPFVALAPNSEVFNAGSKNYGALKMILSPTGYTWEYLTIAGGDFTDSGSGECHSVAASPTPSAVPSPTPSVVPSPIPSPLPSHIPSPVPSPIPRTAAFTPVADAYVYAGNPSTNFGLAAALGVDASPYKNSYLRFDVNGLTGTVVKATLRVYATSSLTTGYQVRSVTNNAWSENTITYNNAPQYSSTVTAVSGKITSGTWVTADVTPLVFGNGSITIALTSTNTTNGGLASRNSANPPQLVVETQ